MGVGLVLFSGLIPELRFRFTLGLGPRLGDDVGLRPPLADGLAGIQPDRVVYRSEVSGLCHNRIGWRMAKAHIPVHV